MMPCRWCGWLAHDSGRRTTPAAARPVLHSAKKNLVSTLQHNMEPSRGLGRSRTTRAASAAPSSLAPPLIPQSFLDSGLQRLVAVLLFVLLQAYKAYDLLVLRTAGSEGTVVTGPQLAFVAKYVVAEAAFVYTLPLFRIPLLTFKPSVVLLQVLVLLAITALLACILISPVLGAVVATWRYAFDTEVTLANEQVHPRDVYDISLHFKGRYTIKYLPDALARLDPWHEHFCFLDAPVHLPVAINATDVALVELIHTSWNGESRLQNYTGAALRRLLVRDPLAELGARGTLQRNHIYAELPAPTPGVYKLGRVQDSRGFGIRVHRAAVLVPVCPSAKLTPTLPDQCVGSPGNVLVVVLGVPPLWVEYSVAIEGREEAVLQVAVAASPQSPLAAAVNVLALAAAHKGTWEWAERTQNVLPLECLLLRPGSHQVRVVLVVDGVGNRFAYNPRSADGDILVEFNAHALPEVRLVDPRPGVPVAAGNRKTLVFDVVGGFKRSDEPYTVTVASGSDNTTFEHVFDGSSTLPVGPGVYTLVLARTRFCGAHVVLSSLVEVKLSPPIVVEVASLPVVDACVGTTAYSFTFDLTGTPPFEIDYTVARQGGLPVKHTLSINLNHHVFDFKPPAAGVYTVTLQQAHNLFYPQGVPIVGHSYKTDFRQPLKIGVLPRTQEICFNTSAQVTIGVEGAGPFDIRYALESPSGARREETVRSDGTQVVVDTPCLRSSGRYKIELVSAVDSRGCAATLAPPVAGILVHPPVVPLLFRQQEFQIAMGSVAHVPLQLAEPRSAARIGNVVYTFTDTAGTVSTHTAQVGSLSSGFRVDKAGVYTLVSFEQNGCPGTAHLLVEVLYFPRPQVEAVPVPQRFCQGAKHSLEWRVQGAAPVQVAYEVVHAQQLALFAATASNGRVVVEAALDSPGSYLYRVTSLSDARYRQSPASAVVEYTVDALPEARLDGGEYTACRLSVDLPSQLDPLPLVLTGQPPFQVEVAVVSGSRRTPHMLSGLLAGQQHGVYTHLLVDVYRGLETGVHRVEVVLVSDANGCRGSGSGRATIRITEVPGMVLSPKRLEPHLSAVGPAYCVGEHIHYALSGEPPFQVHYAFAGKQQVAELGPEFTRLAAAPGRLEVTALLDSSGGCTVNYTWPEHEAAARQLALVVHPLPLVTVLQGDIVEVDIHQGDMTEVLFQFEGTPPFTLTYVRLVEEGRRHRVVERQVVENIQEHSHTIVATLEGTYEAVEVRDRYCVARNY